MDDMQGLASLKPQSEGAEESWGGRSAQWIGAIAIGVVMLLFMNLQSLHSVEPIGCDNFGYARQAELFRTRGLLGGLHTRIDEPQAALLNKLAQDHFSNSADWFQLVAPHCHHYDIRSRKIILQYPPGTGWILSLFPEPYAMQGVLVFGTTISAIALLWLSSRRRLSAIAVATLLGAYGLLFWIVGNETIYWASDSIPATLFLLPPLVAMAAEARPRSLVLAISLGLLCGLLANIRITNVIALAGVGVQIAGSCKLWKRSLLAEHALFVVSLLGGFLVGILPILAANKVNAGGFFHSTYPPLDLAPPDLSIRAIRNGLSYYFSTQVGAATLLAALAFVTFGACRWLDGDRKVVPWGTIGAIVAVVLSLSFFATHTIHIFYYMIPASVLAAFMVGAEVATQSRRSRTNWIFVVAIPIAAFAIHKYGSAEPHMPKITLPAEVMNTQTVLWADQTSGTIYYYTGRLASKFILSTHTTQDAMVDAVREAGHAQYFVLDSDEIRRECDRQAARYGVTRVSDAEDLGAKPVWRLDPSSKGESTTCHP